MQQMRRVVMRPPAMSVPMPRLGRPVDLSKVLACEAIGELANGGGPVTVSDVAAALHVERSTTSRLLAEAEEEGLVVRGSLPDDGRRVSVSLTPLGGEVVAFVQALRLAYLTHAAAVFDDAELATLSSLLSRMADSMSESFAPWLDEASRQSNEASPSAMTSRTTAAAVSRS